MLNSFDLLSGTLNLEDEPLESGFGLLEFVEHGLVKQGLLLALQHPDHPLLVLNFP